MRSLNLAELTLDCRLSPSPVNHVPKSTAAFIREASVARNASNKASLLDEYVNRLEDEMTKIDAFKRELPLCMLLLNDAIATVKEERNNCKNSIAEPIMEEFIPINKTTADEKVEEKDSTNKMNWMSSVQLWNSDDHHKSNYDMIKNKKRKEEAMNPPPTNDLFPSGKNRKVERGFDLPVMLIGKGGRDELSGVTELSLRTPEIKDSKDEIYANGLSSKASSSRSGSSSPTIGHSVVKEQTTRKQRRCWSPELHRRFVSALNRLGGPQAATPKQIRELMQVDGLTNDEVKSHLQKYRLHTRRVSQTTNASTIELGNLWVSQENCGESLKPSNSQSCSPQGPLHLTGSSRVTSLVDSMEEDEDEKSESHSWKSKKSLI